MIQTPSLDNGSIQTTPFDLSSILSLLRTKHLPESFQALKRYLPSQGNKIQFNPPWLGIALALHLNDEEALKEQLELMGMKGPLNSLCQKFSNFQPETKEGTHFWHHVAWSGNYSLLEKAIDEKEFDPLTLKTNAGRTVWHYLGLSGNYKALAEAIAKQQFDPNILKDDFIGATVWHCLAWSGNYKALKEAVVKKQFDPRTLKDNLGWTVWVYLIRQNIGRSAWLELIQGGFVDFFLLDEEKFSFLDLCLAENLSFQLPKDIPLLMEAFIETEQFLGSSFEEIKQVKEHLLSFYQGENAAPLQSHPDIEKLFQEKKMFEALSEKVGFSLGTQTPRMLESKSQEPRVPASLFAFTAQTLNRNKTPIHPLAIPPEAEERMNIFWKWMGKLKRNEQNNLKPVRLV